MSNGSILDLVAKNKIDEDLININNDLSIFNYDIKKKNKYAKGDTIFYPEGKANWSSTFRFNIERQGDLLYGLYLVVKLPVLSTALLNLPNGVPTPNVLDPNGNDYRVKWTEYVGNVMVDKVSLYINGQLIEEMLGDYMQIYTDMYISDWNRKSMLGCTESLNRPNLRIESEIIYIPLRFWFCNDIEKPLPLIAMQHCHIYIDVKFKNFTDCMSVLIKDDRDKLYHSDITHKVVDIENVSLQANYFYLDLEERKETATKEYEILITQSQNRSVSLNTTYNIDLNFNNTIKDLIFYIQPYSNKLYGEYFNYTSRLKLPPPSLFPLTLNQYKLWDIAPQKHLLVRARLLLNGIERIGWRDAKYFYNMQNHENYRNVLHSHVYLYSFNAYPTKDNNYCGCNFSRIENPQLQVEIVPDNLQLDTNLFLATDLSYELKCLVTNFNFLVIKNGLAGLKYAN
jgi:hypothetical protein